MLSCWRKRKVRRGRRFQERGVVEYANKRACERLDRVLLTACVGDLDEDLRGEPLNRQRVRSAKPGNAIMRGIDGVEARGAPLRRWNPPRACCVGAELRAVDRSNAARIDVEVGGL